MRIWFKELFKKNDGIRTGTAIVSSQGGGGMKSFNIVMMM
jgi:hypothetical protein